MPSKLALFLAVALLGSALAGCVSSNPSSDPGPEVPADPSSNTTITEEPPAEAPLPDPEASYDGPANATAVRDACASADDPLACHVDHLRDLLTVRGSEAAFTALEDLAAIDPDADRESHRLAHELGHHAFRVYPSVQSALDNCSFRVFQGCFHGVLQAYFTEVGAVRDEDVQGLCTSDEPFRAYVCLHGLGHGLMLATHYSLHESLDLCATLPTEHGRASCYGGVFMENVVAYMDRELGRGHHTHGHDHALWVDTSDLAYPCNDVDDTYEPACWLMQTSLVLFLNGADWAATASLCEGLDGQSRSDCYRSLGRDASSYVARDATQVSYRCPDAPDDGRAHCIKGFLAEVILNYVSPEEGLARCHQLSQRDKPACYDELGRQGVSVSDAETMEDVCARADPGHVDTCRQAAGLGPAGA